MPMMQRPAVSFVEGGKCWENKYQTFDLKVYVPDNDLDGQTNNYGFHAPLLLVFEEEKQSMESAVNFAKSTGLSKIASSVDSSVLFIHPTSEKGWEGADESLYAELISEVKRSRSIRTASSRILISSRRNSKAFSREARSSARTSTATESRPIMLPNIF